ncbi:Cleavage polyadenylation factor subunit fip1 [Polyrhizophydium stewartii]|uniref:Cleavage polyadenylation factor subunit fip1 n=1 Tax=Polyrhizophydium stewartii TaxID=2732419 RepID=A0ABR4NCM1_9FUNG
MSAQDDDDEFLYGSGADAPSAAGPGPRDDVKAEDTKTEDAGGAPGAAAVAAGNDAPAAGNADAKDEADDSVSVTDSDESDLEVVMTTTQPAATPASGAGAAAAGSGKQAGAPAAGPGASGAAAGASGTPAAPKSAKPTIGLPIPRQDSSAPAAGVGPAAAKSTIDINAMGQFDGKDIIDVEMESFEEKPWRKPGADITDYFNYGFNEQTWRAYCSKQKIMREEIQMQKRLNNELRSDIDYGFDMQAFNAQQRMLGNPMAGLTAGRFQRAPQSGFADARGRQPPVLGKRSRGDDDAVQILGSSGPGGAGPDQPLMLPGMQGDGPGGPAGMAIGGAMPVEAMNFRPDFRQMQRQGVPLPFPPPLAGGIFPGMPGAFMPPGFPKFPQPPHGRPGHAGPMGGRPPGGMPGMPVPPLGAMPMPPHMMEALGDQSARFMSEPRATPPHHSASGDEALRAGPIRAIEDMGRPGGASPAFDRDRSDAGSARGDRDRDRDMDRDGRDRKDRDRRDRERERDRDRDRERERDRDRERERERDRDRERERDRER